MSLSDEKNRFYIVDVYFPYDHIPFEFTNLGDAIRFIENLSRTIRESDSALRVNDDYLIVGSQITYVKITTTIRYNNGTREVKLGLDR